jgi:hypothetical protein
MKSALAGVIAAAIVNVFIFVTTIGFVFLAAIFGYHRNVSSYLNMFTSNVAWFTALAGFLAGFWWEFRRLSCRPRR